MNEQREGPGRMISPAAVQTLLECRRADARGGAEAFEVVVVRPRGTANRIFTLTRALDQLSIVNEPEAA